LGVAGSRSTWEWRSRDPDQARERIRLHLKRLGLIQGLVAMGLGLVLKNVAGRTTTGDVLVVVGAVFGLVATWRPLWLRPVRRLGQALGRGAGTALTLLLLVPFFALVMAPGGLLRRARGRDLLRRRPLAPGLTGWLPRRCPPTRASVARQFIAEDAAALRSVRPEGALPDPAALAWLDDPVEVRP
jgi:hypothetical protein